jgi:3-methylcrotonyl-CoA carboxylase alpha subunit
LEKFSKILIANRGEIAVRVIRAVKSLGTRSVAVYAADDADSLHVSLADEAILLSGVVLTDTYLNEEKLIQCALNAGAEAIHPGYGFLSENAGFAQKVADAGLVFIGPTPENIRLMGEKNTALAYVKSIGIPVLPSIRGTVDEILQSAFEMRFPVIVKASGGGGGKGMVICTSVDELHPALEKAERQAISYFGNGELFIEKYVPSARHIEVQLMADHMGNVLHFFERECTVQRRFQKIMEEAPSPSVDEKLRAELTSAAVEIVQSMNYRNAGTIEFLLDENGQFYFLEMNTRIQVEHPVTEMITGIDLVALQLMVAAGNPLPVSQKDIRISGHAIEVRLCAEDPANQFHPSAGKLTRWNIPEKEGLRLETFVKEEMTVSANYDSLLAKLIVWGENRNTALDRMQEVLAETAVSGVHTNLSFLSGLAEGAAFRENTFYTRYIDDKLDEINRQIQEKKDCLNKQELVIAYLIFHFHQAKHHGKSVWNQIGFWRPTAPFGVLVEGERFECRVRSDRNEWYCMIGDQEVQVSVLSRKEGLLNLEINRQIREFFCTENQGETVILYQGFSFPVRSNLLLSQASVIRKNPEAGKIFQNLICADLFGKVLKINIRENDAVKYGQLLLTLESMKTEIHVLCPVNARVKKIHVTEGNTVIEKQLLVELEAKE